MKKILAVILGVGFLHRLLFLGTRQLWTDELMQARIIKSSSVAEMLVRLREGMDLASPLDFFIQKGMTILLGDSSWALRLHAVIFGTLSIWIFYRIARFLFSERVALYSAALFAFYPLTYHYSQEARPYALLTFLTLLSYDLLLNQVYGKDRPRRGWLAIGAVLTLLLYTSFLGGLIVLAQFAGLVLFSMWRPELQGTLQTTEDERRALSPSALRWSHVAFFAVAALAALILFYPWMRFAWSRPSIAPAAEILNPKLILRLIKELGDNSYPAAALLMIGAVTGIRALLRHGRRISMMWLLTWFLIPIPALLLIEVWAGYFFAIRHILHATPPLLLIAGYGLSYVGERLVLLPHLPYQLSSPAIVYAGLLMAMCVWIGQVHSHSEPADWLGTASFLQRTLRPGDVVAAPMVYPLLEYYYPGLESFRVPDIDAVAGLPASEDGRRRMVVCYDKVFPDPCQGFRTAAQQDPSWIQQPFTSFIVFIRGK